MNRIALLLMLFLFSQPVLATEDGNAKCDWLGVCDEQVTIR